VGIVAVFIYSSIGTVIGAIAGYFGGKPDLIISRIIEIIIMIPSLFLIAILVGLTERSVYVVMLAIGIIGWTGIARLIRGEFLRQRSIDFVVAAQALGASKFRLIFRHILPNAIHPLMVAIPFGIAASATVEGALSFIGYGVRPPTASWGIVLEEARRNLDTLGDKWWLIVFPSLAIFATVALFNLVGNGIRDAVDPRLRGIQ
jgi:peptide/nickel transport system permease protein